jgi:hypothetical protein
VLSLKRERQQREDGGQDHHGDEVRDRQRGKRHRREQRPPPSGVARHAQQRPEREAEERCAELVRHEADGVQALEAGSELARDEEREDRCDPRRQATEPERPGEERHRSRQRRERHHADDFQRAGVRQRADGHPRAAPIDQATPGPLNRNSWYPR